MPPADVQTETVSEQPANEAALYTRLQLRWGIIFCAAELLFLMALAVLNDRFGSGARLRPPFDYPVVNTFIVAGLPFLVYPLVMFPMLHHLYRRLPRRFGVTTLRGWGAIEIAELLLYRQGAAIFLLAAIMVPRLTAESWWPVASAGLVAAWTVASHLSRPRQLWGIKMGKLDDDPKVEALRQFVRQQDVGDPEILALRVSQHSSQILAAAWAVRPGARIYISDTAVEHLTARELRALTAHELGHVKRLDSLRIVATEVIGWVCITMCLCAVLARVAPDPHSWWQAVDAAPLLLLSAWLLSFLSSPFYASASCRQEVRANQEALEMTNDPAGFISVMRKIAESNLVTGRPSWWQKLFFTTHPSLDEVIEQARRYAAEHGMPMEDEAPTPAEGATRPG